VLSLALPFFTPTGFPIPFLSNLSLGGRVNRLTYEFQRFTALAYGGMLNDFRRNQLHLPPIRRTTTLLHDSAGRPLTILYAFSRYVRPIPVEEDLPDSVLMIDNAPHDWLFPKVSAVVHHGGAGTTGAGLRAGRPSLICPVLGDQPFWGHQVRLLGAGPDPLPQRQITAERLADRLNRLSAMRPTATERRQSHVSSKQRTAQPAPSQFSNQFSHYGAENVQI
jgi:hypothetical protein